MKTKVTISLITILAALCKAPAADITIATGSFENTSATINPPALLGTTTGNVGGWTAKFTSFLTLGGFIKSGTALALSGPVPTDGSAELDINLPASVLASASLTQVLTNNYYQPDSTYTLTVSLSEGTTLDLISDTTLSLKAGSTTLASLSGSTLATILNSSGGYHTITLTYKTGNTVPTNQICLALNVANTASLGGNIFVDNFSLTVNPTQVQMNAATTTNDGNVTISGSGGSPMAYFRIVTSTNIFLYETNWVAATTNQFDSNGNFSLAFKIDPNTPYRFFKLYLP